VRAFDLKGGRCLTQHRSDLQVTIFFIQQLHGSNAGLTGSY
jgi:hypothetical protein